MDLGLSDATVAVFGAASGIGAAIARAFAAEGAQDCGYRPRPASYRFCRRVCSFARLGSRRRRLRSRLPRGRGDRSPIRPLPPHCLRRRLRLGQIRLSVLETRSFRLGAGFEGQLAWRRERGACFCTGDGRGAGKAKSDQDASSLSILFLSSVAGQIGSQTDPPYSAAKAAVINFAQCAAKDLAPYGVRVNTLCPGMVQTPLNRSVYEAWAREQPEAERSTYEAWAGEKIKKLIPLNRWQQPEDIAAMAVFLASNRARNITGQTINIDGGWVMHW